MTDEILESVAARRGHFLLESGHHGELWLDLELLCLNPDSVRKYAQAIARQLAPYGIEMVCGPLVEGAFVGLLAALEMGVPFTYSERVAGASDDTLYPFSYRLPLNLRSRVRGKRVAIVNDVINAGSAVRSTFADLRSCGAEPVAVGAILTLGPWAREFAAANQMALEALCVQSNSFWIPSECPLCRNGVALSSIE